MGLQVAIQVMTSWPAAGRENSLHKDLAATLDTTLNAEGIYPSYDFRVGGIADGQPIHVHVELHMHARITLRGLKSDVAYRFHHALDYTDVPTAAKIASDLLVLRNKELLRLRKSLASHCTDASHALIDSGEPDVADKLLENAGIVNALFG